MTPADVEAAVRSLMDTPYQHAGRVPGPRGGVDCAGVPVCTAKILGYEFVDHTVGYSPVSDGVTMVEYFRRSADEVTDLTDIRPSDIGLFWLDRNTRFAQHVAVFVSRPDGIGMVHCFNAVGKVVEHMYRPNQQTRGAYRFWQKRLIHLFRWRGITWHH